MIFRKETIPNFFSAMWKAIKHWWKGDPVLASEESVESRLSVCERCPHFAEDSRQCRVCTCFVDVKVALQDSSCPMDYWR